VRLAYATYGLQTGRTLENYENLMDADPPPMAADKSLTTAPLDVIDQPAVDLKRACELFPTLNETLAPLLSLRGFEAILTRAADALPRSCQPSRLSRADIRMLRAHVAEAVPPSAVKHMMSVFKTPKPGKPVTRLLFNAKELNAAVTRPPRCTMAYLPAHISWKTSLGEKASGQMCGMKD